MEDEELDWRAKLVLKEFEGREVMRYCDLPAGVGLKTMDILVRLGIVKVVDEPGKPHSRGIWQIVN